MLFYQSLSFAAWVCLISICAGLPPGVDVSKLGPCDSSPGITHVTPLQTVDSDWEVVPNVNESAYTWEFDTPHDLISVSVNGSGLSPTFAVSNRHTGLSSFIWKGTIIVADAVDNGTFGLVYDLRYPTAEYAMSHDMMAFLWRSSDDPRRGRNIALHRINYDCARLPTYTDAFIQVPRTVEPRVHVIDCGGTTAPALMTDTAHNALTTNAPESVFWIDQFPAWPWASDALSLPFDRTHPLTDRQHDEANVMLAASTPCCNASDMVVGGELTETPCTVKRGGEDNATWLVEALEGQPAGANATFGRYAHAWQPLQYAGGSTKVLVPNCVRTPNGHDVAALAAHEYAFEMLVVDEPGVEPLVQLSIMYGSSLSGERPPGASDGQLHMPRVIRIPKARSAWPRSQTGRFGIMSVGTQSYAITRQYVGAVTRAMLDKDEPLCSSDVYTVPDADKVMNATAAWGLFANDMDLRGRDLVAYAVLGGQWHAITTSRALKSPYKASDGTSFIIVPSLTLQTKLGGLLTIRSTGAIDYKRPACDKDCNITVDTASYKVGVITGSSLRVGSEACSVRVFLKESGGHIPAAQLVNQSAVPHVGCPEARRCATSGQMVARLYAKDDTAVDCGVKYWDAKQDGNVIKYFDAAALREGRVVVAPAGVRQMTTRPRVATTYSLRVRVADGRPGPLWGGVPVYRVYPECFYKGLCKCNTTFPDPVVWADPDDNSTNASSGSGPSPQPVFGGLGVGGGFPSSSTGSLGTGGTGGTGGSPSPRVTPVAAPKAFVPPFSSLHEVHEEECDCVESTPEGVPIKDGDMCQLCRDNPADGRPTWGPKCMYCEQPVGPNCSMCHAPDHIIENVRAFSCAAGAGDASACDLANETCSDRGRCISIPLPAIAARYPNGGWQTLPAAWDPLADGGAQRNDFPSGCICYDTLAGQASGANMSSTGPTDRWDGKPPSFCSELLPTTHTITPTATISVSGSVSKSRSVSLSPTPPPTRTHTITPSHSASMTRSRSVSLSPTPPPTPSPTHSASRTPPPTPSLTTTRTHGTQTHTYTLSISTTLSPSGSRSRSLTRSHSGSHTSTRAPTITKDPTTSVTISSTLTPRPTATRPHTHTLTPKYVTHTPTPSREITVSATPPITATRTGSVTPTPFGEPCAINSTRMWPNSTTFVDVLPRDYPVGDSSRLIRDFRDTLRDYLGHSSETLAVLGVMMVRSVEDTPLWRVVVAFCTDALGARNPGAAHDEFLAAAAAYCPKTPAYPGTMRLPINAPPVSPKGPVRAPPAPLAAPVPYAPVTRGACVSSALGIYNITLDPQYFEGGPAIIHGPRASGGITVGGVGAEDGVDVPPVRPPPVPKAPRAPRPVAEPDGASGSLVVTLIVLAAVAVTCCCCCCCIAAALFAMRRDKDRKRRDDKARDVESVALHRRAWASTAAEDSPAIPQRGRMQPSNDALLGLLAEVEKGNVRGCAHP